VGFGGLEVLFGVYRGLGKCEVWMKMCEFVRREGFVCVRVVGASFWVLLGMGVRSLDL
jgi:hypothetical protein